MENTIKIEYIQHCSMYDEKPPCNPPCVCIKAYIRGYANNVIETAWFNPHYTVDSLRLPTSLKNKIKADFAPKVWGVDLHG